MAIKVMTGLGRGEVDAGQLRLDLRGGQMVVKQWSKRESGQMVVEEGGSVATSIH